jgi:hypothetical protein
MKEWLRVALATLPALTVTLVVAVALAYPYFDHILTAASIIGAPAVLCWPRRISRLLAVFRAAQNRRLT